MSDRSMPAPIEGRFFPSGSTAESAAVLRREGGDLVLETRGGDRRPVPPIASVSARVGRIPIRIAFADGSVLEVAHDADLRAVTGDDGNRPGLVGRLEGNVAAVIASTVALVLVVVGLWFWGVPAAAHMLAAATPDRVVAAIDAASRETFERALVKPTALPQYRQDGLRRDFGALLAAARYTGPEPRLLFADAPSLGPNALALPGGTVLVTDQFVRAAANDDEILAVLAHEAGHVQARHGLRQLYAAVGVVAVMAMIGGDPGHLADTVATQAGALQMLSYSRAFEREADRTSVAMMTAAGREPMALATILGRIATGNNASVWSTHPDVEERKAEIARLAREARGS